MFADLFDPLPLDVRSTLRQGRDQIIACIDAWLVNYNAGKTIPHAGRVTLEYLRTMGKGMALRSLVTVLGGSATRISGGAATQFDGLWGWFIVVPGTIENRSTDAADIVGEAVRFVTSTPWSRLTARASTGTARFAGTPGSSVPLAQSLARNDGALYSTTVAGVIGVEGIVDLPIMAEDDGSFYDVRAGTTLGVGGPPPGVNATARLITELSGGSDETAFAKTPRADTIQVVPLYKDDDEKTGLSIWLVRWNQEIGLGTATRPRLEPPDILTTIYGFSTLESTPNDDGFTQVVTDA